MMRTTGGGRRLPAGVLAFALACTGGAAPTDEQPGGSGGGGQTSGGSAGQATGAAGQRAGSGGSPAPAGGASGGFAGASGAAGSAGGPPTGGAAGAIARTDGGASDVAPMGGCGAATFCTDFEASALPGELTFFPTYARATMAQRVSLDASVARGGRQSLKVTGTDYSQMLAVATPGPAFWVRFALRSDTDIQMGHNTYVLATDGTGEVNIGQQIRIGEHFCQLELNRGSDDKELLSGGKVYSCAGGGVKLVANTWACIEALFDGPNREVRVFVDGVEATELHVTDWGPYTYKLFKFGFEKYHGGPKTLWYDDVAVGPARIGCTP